VDRSDTHARGAILLSAEVGASAVWIAIIAVGIALVVIDVLRGRAEP
jgi:hypothetical protein